MTIEFVGVRGWGKSTDAGERVVVTLLVTDIVGSTETASRLGDAAWRQLLGRHGDRVRRKLERFRGVEVTTTGDGFLAIFDGAARAVRGVALHTVTRIAALADPGDVLVSASTAALLEGAGLDSTMPASTS